MKFVVSVNSLAHNISLAIFSTSRVYFLSVITAIVPLEGFG
jgi:hypothetical protein